MSIAVSTIMHMVKADFIGSRTGSLTRGGTPSIAMSDIGDNDCIPISIVQDSLCKRMRIIVWQ